MGRDFVLPPLNDSRPGFILRPGPNSAALRCLLGQYRSLGKRYTAGTAGNLTNHHPRPCIEESHPRITVRILGPLARLSISVLASKCGGLSVVSSSRIVNLGRTRRFSQWSLAGKRMVFRRSMRTSSKIEAWLPREIFHPEPVLRRGCARPPALRPDRCRSLFS